MPQDGGLSTETALIRLISELKTIMASYEKTMWTREKWSYLVHQSMSVANDMSLFPWTSIALTLLSLVLLLGVGMSKSDFWLISESLLILALLGANIGLNVQNHYLREVEMLRRIKHVVHKLERYLSNGISWSQENYPHLHTPLSASVVLQWTVRDGNKINLPWALLVKDDLIYLKPGQVAPGRCHSEKDSNVVVNKGEILYLQTGKGEDLNSDYISPIPEFKPSVEPQLFRLEETPYLGTVQAVLSRNELERPSSRLDKYQHLFFVRILSQALAPLSLVLMLISSVVRYSNGWFIEDWIDLLILAPITVTLPLIPLSFPLYWTVANYVALAKVMNDYWSFRHVHVSDDPFDDAPCNQQPDIIFERTTAVSSLRDSFFSALLGRGEYLSRTENLVHVLGSLTALCCTDKKGILSWPNTSAEKVFILRPGDNKENNKEAEKHADGKHNLMVPEILTITHDHRNPFKMDFDDPSWKIYMDHLKPLGLSILLNTCNISTEEKYTNFFNHLVCESMRLEHESQIQDKDPSTRSAESVQDSKNGHHGGIELLPIVTRGCLCELAKKIGFDPATMEKNYALANQIQTFRHIRRSSGDAGANSKFIHNLHLAKLKFPFPHMVSVMMQPKAKDSRGSNHLISQGTADIILDSCVDAWTGHDLEPLNEDVRKKVLDFYQRASLSSYCTAFSYRPLILPFPWASVGEYLQLPSHSLPFYSQYVENAAWNDSEALQNGHISLGTCPPSRENFQLNQKDETHVKTKDDALACLELECNQTFLGMVQLQYQALVEFVQLIDLLEKACIRFVHFSKENELRSRVFSEKMGLESGWNCHISLKGNESMKKTVSYCCPQSRQVTKKKSIKRAAAPLVTTPLYRFNLVGSSLPEKLDRHPWFLDFPRWHETKRGETEDRTFVSSSSHLKAFQMDECQENAATSRQASVTSDSDPFDYDMSNRAQLPKGIENIRPHLETMDNVPLLVSLFTDCTPSNTREMIVIMQDYGEVVCVMGSAANHHNMLIFLQADASLAIEPLYPQVCQNVPVFQLPNSVGCPSPTTLSQLLISVASSLSFHMEDEVSIFHLILESRHFSLCLLNAMQFWASSLIFIMTAQAICQVLTLPLFLSPGQTLWLTILVIPMLSMSLLGPKAPDKDVMNISTGKNQVMVDRYTVGHALWCYGLRFVPTVAIFMMAHGVASMSKVANNHVNLVMMLIYLVAISLSFLFRARHLWQKHPGHNKLWMWAVLLLVVLQSVYTCIVVACSSNFSMPPETSWIIWAIGAPVVVVLNEAVKRYEIKGEVRYQKRQRLEFGTKLGINSPF